MSTIVEIVGREVLDSRGNPTVEVDVELLSGARGPGHRPERRQHRRPRGPRAARRRRALRRQGRAHRGRARQHRDRRRHRRPRRLRPAPPRRRARHPRRHRRQAPPRRQRDPRRVARGGEGRGRRSRAAAVPLRRWRQRARAAGAVHERAQRRRARRLQRRRAGVHARARRRRQLRRGAALGRRDVPRAQGAAAGARPRPPRWATKAGSRPNLPSNEEALTLLLAAIERAGYTPGDEIALALDVASTELFADGRYVLAGEGADVLADRSGRAGSSSCATATRSCRSRTACPRTTGTAGRRSPTALGARVQLVGDDLFVTNVERFAAGHRPRRRQLDPGEGEPDRHAVGDARHDVRGRSPRLHRDDVAPQRRDRGRDHRRPRRRHQLRPDQDRRARRAATASPSTTSSCASRRSSVRWRRTSARRRCPPRVDAVPEQSRREARSKAQAEAEAAAKRRTAKRDGSRAARAGRRCGWRSFLVVLVGLLFVFVYPTRTFLDQRDETNKARAQLAVLQAENARLAQESKRLSTDSEIERLARQKYGLVKPGETPVRDPPRAHRRRTAPPAHAARCRDRSVDCGAWPAAPADVAALTERLGRAPQADFDVVVRDAAGAPVVVRNAPVHPRRHADAHALLAGRSRPQPADLRLEAAGGVRGGRRPRSTMPRSAPPTTPTPPSATPRSPPTTPVLVRRAGSAARARA